MQTLWEMPFPSSSLAGGEISCETRRGDKLEIIIQVSEKKSIRLGFHDVYSVRCTFEMACTGEMIDAYDQVVDVGKSDFLEAVVAQMQKREGVDATSGIRHLRVYFDDGPCFEFICRSFTADQTLQTDKGTDWTPYSI